MTQIPPVSNIAHLGKQQLSQNEAVPRLKEDSVHERYESLRKQNRGRGGECLYADEHILEWTI